MRRLTILLLILSAAAGLRHVPARQTSGHRSAAVESESFSVAGQWATARLIRDAGLTLTAAELPRQIVHAVLVDVDADGDADLVANIGSLDLGVWINDGSGRLTRARASSASADWAPLPPVPTVEARTARLDVTVPDAGSPLMAGRVRAGPVPAATSTIAAPSRQPAASPRDDASSPRAPPLA